MFESLSNLKTLDEEKLETSPYHNNLVEDYRNIMYLCKEKQDIRVISLDESTKILIGMKSSVKDFFSITPMHFINAGIKGLTHFNFLLNAVIQDVNNSTIEELNVVLAILLHKGHNKSKTDHQSYRTISTCPVLAKALDSFIRDLNVDKWDIVQADTQYQGAGSSHELASLLITETIQYSLYTSKKPIFQLYLDARSAFDNVIIQYFIRNLYFSGTDDSSLLYINNRMTNRKTYCEWNKVVVGPINDEKGFEQGGGYSSDGYKLYNNEVLNTAQASKQGVSLGNNLVVSAVGQADDTVLVTNDIFSLRNILLIVLEYCLKYNVELSSQKTKLMVIGSQHLKQDIVYNPIRIHNTEIQFTEQAEHVGVIRSVDGNLPNILNRIVSHKRALNAVLSCGLTRAHRSNPAAALRVLQLYSTPVLLSGLASLVLTKSEIATIDHHFLDTMQNLQKLIPKNPA